MTALKKAERDVTTALVAHLAVTQMPAITQIFGDALVSRRALGIERYGAPLTTCTPIEPVKETMDELLDATVYAQRQYIDDPCEETRLVLELSITATKAQIAYWRHRRQGE